MAHHGRNAGRVGPVPLRDERQIRRLGLVTGAVVGPCGVVFARGSADAVRECRDVGGCDMSAGLVGMALSAFAGALVIGGLWLVVARWRGRRGVPGALIAAIAAALLAAAPVRVGWKTCNSHSATMAVGVGIVTAIVAPEDGTLNFGETSTLMACVEPGVLFPPPPER